ncbi:MAG: hypothetical protein JSV03_10990 [Planctomycetota bacterium]|nr:MAG: hypothetical protein JSV03_10990 [Planctomycetota bacterium]
MSDLYDVLRERLGFMLSLPERTIRSLAALAAGTTSLLSETLFPDVLRETTLYKIFVGDTQRFVADKVAQVKTEADEEGEPQSEDYLQRKMVGGALETAGLFAMHFSPLWVFAIAGDAAAGGKVFLDRLVEQLKRNGILPEDTEIKSVHDLFEAMRETSAKSTAAIDTPPLSREEISKLAGEMTECYKKMFAKAKDLVPRLETIWQQMQELAKREKVTVERISGILTVDIPEFTKKGLATALAVGQTGTELFGEKVLDSYADTLDKVNKEGLPTFVSERMKPFMQAVVDHFDSGKKTWTESIWDSATKGKADQSPEAQAPEGENESDIPKPEDEVGKGI